MNKQVKIEATGSVNRFINKCISNKIYLSNISYIDNNKITCIINLDILTNVGIVDTGNFIFVTK